MKQITIDLGNAQFIINIGDNGSGGIMSTLVRDVAELADHDDYDVSLNFNSFLDGIESLILAHACAGVDVKDPRYIDGIKTALESAGNNLP